MSTNLRIYRNCTPLQGYWRRALPNPEPSGLQCSRQDVVLVADNELCGVSVDLRRVAAVGCALEHMHVRLHAGAACTGNTCMRWQYMHALAGPIRTRAQPPARGGGRLEIADYTMPSRCNVSTAVAKVNKRGRALLLSSGWVKRLKNTHRMQAALSLCMAIQRNHVTIRPCTSEGLCSRRPCTHNTRVGVEI